MPKKSKDFWVTVLLMLLVIFLFFVNIENTRSFEIRAPTNIKYDEETNTLYLDSLTLKQKIAQMIIAYGYEENKEDLQRMFIGGVYLNARITKDAFIDSVNYFQEGAVIPFLVSVDLEGCINPFVNFQQFPTLRQIKTKEDAYELGYDHSLLLREVGVDINLAPVVDLKDSIWKCRSFPGTPKEISEKAEAYINGMHVHGVLTTAKHYPGQTLDIRDPHKYMVFAKITEEDLLPYKTVIEDNVSAIMVTHTVAEGAVDSEGKPAVVSQKLVWGLRKDFDGLIITDDIGMQGLKAYYSNIDEMYVDLFRAGSDLIINFDNDPNELAYMISAVELAVKNGEISEKRIDDSVTRILKAKGINVK